MYYYHSHCFLSEVNLEIQDAKKLDVLSLDIN